MKQSLPGSLHSAPLGWTLFFWVALAAVPGTMPSAQAEPVRAGHVTVELVASRQGIAPGETINAALRIEHDPSWHTYWETPVTGFPPALEWTLPEGFEASGLRFPVPEVKELLGQVDFAYEGEAFFPFTVTAPPSASAGEVITLEAAAEWLMCAEVCVPGSALLTLELPVTDEPAGPAAHADSIAAAIKRTPRVFDAWEATAYRHGSGEERYTLVLDPVVGKARENPGEVYFFSLEGSVVPEARQAQRWVDGQLHIDLTRAEYAREEGRLAGVLYAPAGWVERDPALVAWAIAPEVRLAPPPVSASATGDGSAASPAALEGGILVALLGAFLGGLILNLMPCVFPVIGLKIMGFVNHAGEDRRKIAKHGLLFTGGVLVSFWVLSGLLIALRAAGNQVGWGFQLQDPGFVFFMVVFLLVFGLNMSGVFEIGGSAVGVGSKLTGRRDLAGTFFSGVLATVVATPCAAPFLAPALGVALQVPPFQSLIFFTVIALGLAGPYLVLSLFPDLIRRLPRPGPWMESFKQFLAFLLYAAAGYLLIVLIRQIGQQAAENAVVGLTVVAMAAWIFGRWTSPVRKAGVRRAGMAGAGLALLVGLALGFPGRILPRDEDAPPEVVWQTWSPEAVSENLAAGRPVYVDFTATWCLTCSYNKRRVFGSERVLREFDQRNVAALKADWTNRDPEITQVLQEYGRAAVPFNLIYLPGQNEPVVLPELLSPEIVLENLQTQTAREGSPNASSGSATSASVSE